MITALKNAELFLPIITTDAGGAKLVHYGGDQAWYKTRVGKYSGCGAVAAADIFAYLARQNSGLKSLYTDDSPEISAERFLEHMDDVIKYVKPGKIPFIDMPYSGLTSLPRFVRYCEAFAHSRGVGLKGNYHTNKELDVHRAVAKIEEQLADDNPIALLNMQNVKLKDVKHTDVYGNPIVSDLRFHWIVITQMERTDDAAVITGSSEGFRVVVDFNDVWNTDSESAFGWRGIVYFADKD